MNFEKLYFNLIIKNMLEKLIKFNSFFQEIFLKFFFESLNKNIFFGLLKAYRMHH